MRGLLYKYALLSYMTLNACPSHNSYQCSLYNNMLSRYCNLPLGMAETGSMPFILVLPPLIKCLLPLARIISAPLYHQPPCPCPYDILHRSLLPDQRSQPLRPRLSWEVSRRIGIQPLIHDPLPNPLILHLSQHRFRIIRVLARSY